MCFNYLYFNYFTTLDGSGGDTQKVTITIGLNAPDALPRPTNSVKALKWDKT